MRFHVVSLPHTQISRDYDHCAYTAKVRRFCDMMYSLGYEVFLYASEEAECSYTHHHIAITKQEQKDLIGIESPEDNLKAEFNVNKPYWQLMNQRAIEAIKERIEPKDFICLIAGLCQKPIADAFPEHISVEYGVGYEGIFSKFRVFESYAWMHTVYGKFYGASNADGFFFDEVIPNYISIDEVTYSRQKDDYYLYMGRLIDRKGYRIAIEACKEAGVKLFLAGQGEPPEGADYLGVVHGADKQDLLAHARAVFVPTQYIEPFGTVAVEAMMSGTPVITTDWGAFTETVEEGVTGYRCRTLKEFVYAIHRVDSLDRKIIREKTVARFGTHVVKYAYQEYFRRLLTLWRKGWYEV